MKGMMVLDSSFRAGMWQGLDVAARKDACFHASMHECTIPDAEGTAPSALEAISGISDRIPELLHNPWRAYILQLTRTLATSKGRGFDEENWGIRSPLYCMKN